jgi:hypothetical protein
MDLGERVSAEHYRRRAERLRALAADATTVRAKEHLLAQARDSAARATGHGIVARPAADDEREGRLRWGARR